MSNSLELHGRRALITGGGHGLGRGIAFALARAGASVFVCGRKQAPLDETVALLRAEGFNAAYGICDVGDEGSVAAAVAEAEAQLGGIDILVNNAGVATSAPLQKTDLATWESTLRINATGPFLLTRACASGMLSRGFGRVVNVASVAGIGGSAYLSAYCASKHALIGFTRAAAAELGNRGVHVNALCPGYIDTDMARQGVDRLMATRGVSEDEAIRRVLATSNQKRMLTVDEVSGWVLQLCGAASRGMNGQIIVLDGGGAS